MHSAGSLILIVLLIALSAFFSVAELSMASARRLRLRQLADDGDARAAAVLKVQAQPGSYFTVVQIGQNIVAILAGVVGDDALGPGLRALLDGLMPPRAADVTSFALSFGVVTSLFILLADLLPKRLALVEPEGLAMKLLAPMRVAMLLLRPVVWVFNGLANGLVRLLGLPKERDDRITSADILALTEAGTEAGVLHVGEQEVIENLLELETRTVESAMTTRDRIVFLLQDDPEELIRARIAAEPHSTYLVCDEHIDQVVGYVDAADLFARVLRQEPIVLQGEAAKGLLQKVLMVPDRLTLSEVLARFREAHEDFAVIVNEYGLVVGVITLNDVMSTVMGSLVGGGDEEQIVRRDDGSWLMDGLTPIGDVLRALHLDPADLPQRGQYDTLAGFLMVMLRRIPRRTDHTTWNGWRFEVIDVDHTRIDQVLVTGVAGQPAAAVEVAVRV
ncbi:hemolysin family protein [Azohydromonas aeria]|uniref:hemolysin family protein n=1 Tax=Azohydromonas aeria TaxID=2590212 RepID=UPI0012FA9972|nr:hemolysin family protein [Azohydromonas aeria]